MSDILQKFSFTSQKIYVLKPEQIEEVEWLLAGHDVLSNLPTGFGKSSIYQVFCFANLGMNSQGLELTEPGPPAVHSI